ncbi:MAG: hypothetical protein AAF363_18770 [Bacteroidota bacterium]
MKHYIKLPCDAVTKRFFEKFFDDDINKKVVPLNYSNDISLVINETCLTDSRENRLIEPHFPNCSLQAILPTKLFGYYISKDKERFVVIFLKNMMWQELKKILREPAGFAPKIEELYSKGYFDQDELSEDTFRRQISRKGIHSGVNYNLKKTKHRKLTNETAMHIAKQIIVYKCSSREVGNAYGISHVHALRISKKYESILKKVS